MKYFGNFRKNELGMKFYQQTIIQTKRRPQRGRRKWYRVTEYLVRFLVKITPQKREKCSNNCYQGFGKCNAFCSTTLLLEFQHIPIQIPG